MTARHDFHTSQLSLSRAVGLALLSQRRVIASPVDVLKRVSGRKRQIRDVL